jgi:hypothetical protein
MSGLRSGASGSSNFPGFQLDAGEIGSFSGLRARAPRWRALCVGGKRGSSAIPRAPAPWTPRWIRRRGVSSQDCKRERIIGWKTATGDRPLIDIAWGLRGGWTRAAAVIGWLQCRGRGRAGGRGDIASASVIQSVSQWSNTPFSHTF